MAAFSSTPFHHHHPFLLDSLLLPNSPSTTTTDNKNIIFTSSPPLLHQLPNNNIIANYNFNQQNQDLVENDVNKASMDNSSSIVTDKYDSSEQPLTTPINNKRKHKAAQSKDKRQVKGKKKKTNNGEEKKSNSKEENKAEEVGYIHVRAKRGQATDSHSLAERVRRERISERMKLLQALVPGCDKVTGKALMLDEIINYVQSLQNQVEFLSMKLASVNPMFYDFGMDLESFMVRPDHQDLSELASMQECSPKTGNGYSVMDNNPILFQNVLPHPQGSRQTLWEVDEHRQKIINQSGFNSSLFSFH